jgi:YesN/AraC family two-component response regulator
MMESCDVRVAVDGEDCYSNLLTFKHDVIFTDFVIPRMLGIELIKKSKVEPEIKVSHVSGFFCLRNIRRKLDKDIAKYNYPFLSKPFRISTVMELVHAYIKDQTGIDIKA